MPIEPFQRRDFTMRQIENSIDSVIIIIVIGSESNSFGGFESIDVD